MANEEQAHPLAEEGATSAPRDDTVASRPTHGHGRKPHRAMRTESTATTKTTTTETTMTKGPLVASSDAPQRLSMVAPTRLLLGGLASSAVGFALGALQGGQAAQLRFRAEHAHKMPDTTTGWYLYHKSKNYHAMQGGIREGVRMAARTGFWSFAALGLETTVDRMRGSSDMLSTIVATVSVAGMFSLTHRFSLSAAARTARYGLMFGIVYGGVQDLSALARGRPIGYIEAIRRRTSPA